MSNVTTIGFKEFEDKLRLLPKEVLEEVDFECKDAAAMWEQLAKNFAPVDTDRLRGNITSKQIAFLNYEVTSPIIYSPYQEWGTGTRVSIPPELVEYASQFRGKVQITGGVPPHPYFFIQKSQVNEFLIKRIKTILERPR